MAHWLLKTEPETYSWADQLKHGAKGEPWTGVRNHQAKLNLMRMKNGDRGFFYHSGEAKEIVGIDRGYPRALSRSDREIRRAVGRRRRRGDRAVEDAVTLADAKAEPRLKAMVLVNNTRLSVQPVTADEWKIVCKMGGVKA